MRHVRILGILLVAVLVLSAIASATAMAEEVPTESLKIYKNCPTTATGFEGLVCVYAQTEKGAGGGEYTVGGITVPLLKSVKLQYGLGIFYPESGEEDIYVAPTNGVEAITPTPELVPGTPIAHITPAEQEEMGWPATLKNKYKEGQKHHSVNKVYETIELAGIPETNRGNILFQEGTGVEAPIMIKGENKWLSELGDVCYIGSETNPIVQHLTSGSSTSPLTGETIKGEVFPISFFHEYTDVAVPSILVDNTYPVPGASCTGPYATYIAATLDKEFGIPAVAGASKTELKGILYNADAEEVARELH